MGAIAKPIGSLFGLGNSQGEYYNPERGALEQYYRNMNDRPDSVDGIKGSRMAAKEVQANPMMSNLFGDDGLQNRLATEEKDLSTRGFQLNEQDHEAYGQASGDIARQFGQQDQDITKSLAKRGLASGASGAAGAAFSGAAGNKNEMLAQAQTSIAQKRMADTSSRLQQTRSMMKGLGELGAQETGNQFGRQMDSRKAKMGEMETAVNSELGMNKQGRDAQQDRTGAQAKNLGHAVSEGGYSGVKQGTSKMVGSMMGGASMMSDEDMKMDVEDGSKKVRGFLDSMGGQKQDPNATPSDMKHDDTKGRPNYEVEEEGGGGGGDMMGSIMEMAPMAMSMFSDENNKCDIEPGGEEIRGFLDSVKPNHYEYKDEAKGSLLGGSGEYVSPMAQELEQTELGADMVEDTPDGKVVDYGKGFGTLLAAQSDLNSRLKALEGGKR